jgi:DNA-binding MarR family transcriptional regulator
MGLFARSNRFVSVARRRIDTALTAHELSLADFDVLSALRRVGAPFSLKPSELAERLMVTRGGITARIDALEPRGLVARQRDLSDRRSEPILLTPAGLRLVDRAVVSVLEVEQSLYEGLTKAELAALDRTLRRLS